MGRPVEGLAGFRAGPRMRSPVVFKVDSGVQGIHLGVHPPSICYCVVIYEFWGGFRLGWLPKKIALTLAMCRASPPSIRFRPERNRKTRTWRIGRSSGSGWTPVRTLGSTTASIPRPNARAVSHARLSRVYPIHTLGSRFLSLRKVSAGHFPIPRDPLRRACQFDHLLLRQVAVEPTVIEAQ